MLGGTVSAASGINAAGQVVGQTLISGNAAYHAFLFTAGIMHDLNSLIGPVLSLSYLNEAGAINDSGQIAATGIMADGSRHAFRLDPVGSVPEPSSFLLAGSFLASALAGTWLRARRR